MFVKLDAVDDEMRFIPKPTRPFQIPGFLKQDNNLRQENMESLEWSWSKY